jgi:hypothetical protein
MGRKKDTKPLMSVYEKLLRNQLKPDGIHPFPILIRNVKGAAILGTVDAPRPDIALRQANKLYLSERGVEMAFCIDRESGKLKEEGTKAKDFVSIFHYKDGQWRMGLLYYYPTDGGRVEDYVEWDNTFWIEQMRKEAAAFMPLQ